MTTSLGKHRWTEQDEENLRIIFDGSRASVERLSLDIGVPYRVVRDRISRLGLSTRRASKWTIEEDSRLEELVGVVSLADIGRMLGRSRHSICLRIRLRGLSRRAHNGWFTSKDVSEILGVNSSRVGRYIKEGKLAASRHDGSKWHIASSEFRKFIIKYCLDFTGRNIDLFTIVNVLVDGDKDA